MDRKGVEQPLSAPARGYRTPRISPDGRRVAVTSSEAGDNIWLYDLARETLTRLTFEGRINATPIWTPDGRRIAFTSERTGAPNVFWQPADGSGGAEQLIYLWVYSSRQGRTFILEDHFAEPRGSGLRLADCPGQVAANASFRVAELTAQNPARTNAGLEYTRERRAG